MIHFHKNLYQTSPKEENKEQYSQTVSIQQFPNNLSPQYQMKNNNNNVYYINTPSKHSTQNKQFNIRDIKGISILKQYTDKYKEKPKNITIASAFISQEIQGKLTHPLDLQQTVNDIESSEKLHQNTQEKTDQSGEIFSKIVAQDQFSGNLHLEEPSKSSFNIIKNKSIISTNCNKEFTIRENSNLDINQMSQSKSDKNIIDLNVANQNQNEIFSKLDQYLLGEKNQNSTQQEIQNQIYKSDEKYNNNDNKNNNIPFIGMKTKEDDSLFQYTEDTGFTTPKTHSIRTQNQILKIPILRKSEHQNPNFSTQTPSEISYLQQDYQIKTVRNNFYGLNQSQGQSSPQKLQNRERIQSLIDRTGELGEQEKKSQIQDRKSILEKMGGFKQVVEQVMNGLKQGRKKNNETAQTDFPKIIPGSSPRKSNYFQKIVDEVVDKKKTEGDAQVVKTRLSRRFTLFVPGQMKIDDPNSVFSDYVYMCHFENEVYSKLTEQIKLSSQQNHEYNYNIEKFCLCSIEVFCFHIQKFISHCITVIQKDMKQNKTSFKCQKNSSSYVGVRLNNFLVESLKKDLISVFSCLRIQEKSSIFKFLQNEVESHLQPTTLLDQLGGGFQIKEIIKQLMDQTQSTEHDEEEAYFQFALALVTDDQLRMKQFIDKHRKKVIFNNLDFYMLQFNIFQVLSTSFKEIHEEIIAQVLEQIQLLRRYLFSSSYLIDEKLVPVASQVLAREIFQSGILDQTERNVLAGYRQLAQETINFLFGSISNINYLALLSKKYQLIPISSKQEGAEQKSDNIFYILEGISVKILPQYNSKYLFLNGLKFQFFKLKVTYGTINFEWSYTNKLIELKRSFSEKVDIRMLNGGKEMRLMQSDYVNHSFLTYFLFGVVSSYDYFSVFQASVALIFHNYQKEVFPLWMEELSQSLNDYIFNQKKKNIFIKVFSALFQQIL